MAIEITTTDKTIAVKSPYNREFVPAAKNLGGTWRPPYWEFDIRDEERVRALCLQVYGDDGRGPADLVTLRVTYLKRRYADRGPLTLHGRPIARAFGRDSGAKPEAGVVLLEGEFDSGGSVKNWETVAPAGTVALVRDFPRAAAEALAAESDESVAYTIEEEACPEVSRGALKEERAKLATRIAEIDRLLAESEE